MSHFPNVAAIARELCPANPNGQQQLMTYALQCIQPGFGYLAHIFSTTLKDAVTAFKAARLFNPHEVQEIQPSLHEVDFLDVFPLFNGVQTSRLNYLYTSLKLWMFLQLFVLFSGGDQTSSLVFSCKEYTSTPTFVCSIRESVFLIEQLFYSETRQYS